MQRIPTLLAAAAAAAAAAVAVATPAAAAPDLAKLSPAELAVVLKAFPKGGELHNHLGGGTPAELILDWAAEDGMCVNTAELAIARGCSGENVKPAAEVMANEALRSAMLDSLSTRHPDFRDRSGHDQFFTAFSRRSTSPKRSGDALAETLEGLARQNTFYAELMVTPQYLQARGLGAQVGWKGDPAATKAALAAAGIEKFVPAAIAETDAMVSRAREVMKCDTPQAARGCQVTARFLFQAMRDGKPEQTMAQLQLGVAVIAADKRWVGLQLVAPEDGYEATKYYDVHMRIVAELTDQGRKVPVALHAGEVTLKLVTPAEVSHRVTDAVRIAGARRIGHGTALPLEVDAQAVAREMAAKGVLIETNLVSNSVILEVTPEEHPYAWFRKMGVPAAFSTDDSGISRHELWGDYAFAVRNGATYADLKTAARNGIAFSFLAGEGLWSDPNVYRTPVKACAGQVGNDEPKGACAEFVAKSDKAREQWRHERLLKAFEAAY